MHLCIGFAFLFFVTAARAQVCSTDTKLLQYDAGVFQNSLALAFPQSLTLADKGAVYFMNKHTAAGDSLLVFKTAADGSVLWGKAWNETTPSFACQLNHAIEMPNGNLLFTGSVASWPGYTASPKVCLLLTDASGNLLWQKIYTNSGTDGFCTPGKNGEIILFGYWNTSQQMQLSILDAAGNVMRTASYSDPAGTMVIYPGNVVFENDRICLMNTYNDYNITRGSSVGFFSMLFDYASLQLTDNKVYALHHATPACDSLLPLSAGFTTAANGRFVFSGALTFNNCPAVSRFFVQLDADLHIIGDRVQAFSCNRGGRYFLTDEHFGVDRATGNMTYGITYNDNGCSAYYAVIDTNYFPVIQRKITTPDALDNPAVMLPGFDICGLSPGLNAGGAYYQLNRLSADATDLASCIGEDTAFLVASPLVATPITISWAKNSPAPPVPADQFPPSQDFVINTTVLCQQKSTCDSIKINGAARYCLGDSSAVLTLYKNPQCNKKSAWNIDTAAFSRIEHIDDTTIRIHFNKGWKGYIYASPAGCDLKDSLLLDIRAPMADPGIGGDTVLCPGATIILHAEGAFKTYRWQDGSTDSTYIVRDTGLYRLTVTDSCDNSYSGAWTVGKANIGFDLGQDPEICGKDSAAIALPDGFTGYSWFPADASLHGNTLLLYPAQTTSFYITAQKMPGCTVTDTITVVVTDCHDKLYFPSAFTPNADGKNDSFRPHADGKLSFFEMAVFNRWGQQLFKTTDPAKGWDGLFRGVKQSPGAYIWYCKYRFGNAPLKTAKGSLLLLP